MLVESGICDAKKTFDEVISVGGAEGLSTFLGYFTLVPAVAKGFPFGFLVPTQLNFTDRTVNH